MRKIIFKKSETEKAIKAWYEKNAKKEGILENYIVAPDGEYIECSETGRELEDLTRFLEADGIISFSLYRREDGDGNDAWLQCEFCSPKLDKTVIFDYNYQDSFEDMDEVFETLASTEEAIQAFEKSISITK
jgi:hypothetical protein